MKVFQNKNASRLMILLRRSEAGSAEESAWIQLARSLETVVTSSRFCTFLLWTDGGTTNVFLLNDCPQEEDYLLSPRCKCSIFGLVEL